MTENGVDSFIVALLSLAFHSVLAYQVASAQLASYSARGARFLPRRN